ncbi:hypothetical protein [Agromyces italicus]|uniref:hypothetical protein n=1 Tax=Agromyces italicus TaxID=279572 RepID=UPI0003B63DFC|nr:hypothetical protein [Agromyces italicus]
MSPTAAELVATAARLAATPRHRADVARFIADVESLELRLAIIDDRFERFASRPDEDYRVWRRDLVGRLRSLAAKAGELEAAGALEPRHRDRVAALLLTLRHRLGAVDARRSALRRRRR